MAAPDRLARLAATAALAACLGACAGGGEPELGTRRTEAGDAIAQTKQAAEEGTGAALPDGSDPQPAGEPPVAPASDAAPPAPAAVSDPGSVVRIESGKPEDDAGEPSLFEASQAERQRRLERGAPPAIVITNANLDAYAKGGNLTESTRDGSVEASQEAPTLSAAANDVAEDPETYWRTRARDVRLAWRAAADRAVELEKEVAQLRFDFYSQDDPAYRDLEIKPAWDRALVELSLARKRVMDLELQVDRTLEEGVEAGALPGWLREGIDFEPERSNPSKRPQPPGTAESIEPPILEDPPL